MRPQTSNNEFKNSVKNNKEGKLHKNIFESRMKRNPETVEYLLNKIYHKTQKEKEGRIQEFVTVKESFKNYYDNQNIIPALQPTSNKKPNLSTNRSSEEDGPFRNISIVRKLSIGECFTEGINPKIDG